MYEILNLILYLVCNSKIVLLFFQTNTCLYNQVFFIKNQTKEIVQCKITILFQKYISLFNKIVKCTLPKNYLLKRIIEKYLFD